MADIRWIYAPIGGGKTFFAVIEGTKELERSDRYLVTNIPYCLSSSDADHTNLQDWCQEHIKKPVDVARRVFLLTPEQTFEFWRYLPYDGQTADEMKAAGLELVVNQTPHGECRGIRLPVVKEAGFGEMPDFSYRTAGGVRRSVYFQIDEVHQFFPSRNWQKSGPSVERYMSQLRKLNDDLDLITQDPGKVDKNFRRNATEWLYVQNMSRNPLFLGVTLDLRFRFHLYQQPDMPEKRDRPTVSGWYRVDGKKHHERLYFTMVGVGVSGGLVKENMRRKGRHPTIWLVFLLGVVLGAWLLPRLIEEATVRLVGAAAAGIERGAVRGVGTIVQPPPAVPATTVNHSENFPAVPAAGVPLASPAVAPRSFAGPPGLYCTGFCPVGTNVEIFLSDGRIAFSDNPGDVQAWGKAGVRVFGLPYTIPLKKYSDSPSPSSGSPPPLPRFR